MAKNGSGSLVARSLDAPAVSPDEERAALMAALNLNPEGGSGKAKRSRRNAEPKAKKPKPEQTLSELVPASAPAPAPADPFDLPDPAEVRASLEAREKKETREIAESRERAESLKSTILSGIKRIGEYLADAKLLDAMRERVEGAHQRLLELVQEAAGLPQQLFGEVVLETMRAIIANWAPTLQSLTYLGEVGSAAGFFGNAGEHSSTEEKFFLPTRAGGRVSWRPFVVSFPGSRGMLHELKLKKFTELYSQRERQLVAAGTVTFSEAVKQEKGEGLAIFHGDDGRVRHLRVLVQDGEIAVAKRGPCAVGPAQFIEFAEELRRRGIYLPLSQLGRERPRVNFEGEDLRLVQRFSDFLSAALAEEKEAEGNGGVEAGEGGDKREARLADLRARSEALRVRATIPAEDFVARERPGVAYLYVRGGWTATTQGRERRYPVTFLAERREDGAVRVADCIRECASLFAECREFMEPGDRYGALPYPLGQILRRLDAILRRRPHQAKSEE
jgi:hypothetical protein